MFHRPILLLYDWDAGKPEDQVERLWVRSIPRNTENNKVNKGIENLFPSELFDDCFYCEYPGDDGGYTRRLNKNKFCDWICEERKNANDFEKFDRIVEILEEFVQAHQTQPVQ